MNGSQETATWLLWRSGVSAISRKILTRRGRFVLEFHNVLPQRRIDAAVDVTIGLTSDELFAILKWVDERFSFLTPEEFLRGNKPGVLLTFDDGMAGNVNYALPILEQFKAPALFFVSTQHVRDPHNWLPAGRALADKMWPSGSFGQDAHVAFDGMSETQLAAIGRHPLVTIGGHTVSHPFLTQCDDASLGYELEESKRYLSRISGQPVDLFAYPTGDYDRRVTLAVRAAGYRAAFAELSQDVGLPNYEIPRVGIYGADPGYLSTKLSGLHQAAIKRQYE